jgi:hypothetical protein
MSTNSCHFVTECVIYKFWGFLGRVKFQGGVLDLVGLEKWVKVQM